MQSSRSKLISFEFSNAASKTETNRDNTNRETGNPDIINHPGNAGKWKLISFKLSNAELEQIKSMPSPAGKHLEATRTFLWIRISKPRNRATDYKFDLVQHQHIEVAMKESIMMMMMMMMMMNQHCWTCAAAGLRNSKKPLLVDATQTWNYWRRGPHCSKRATSSLNNSLHWQDCIVAGPAAGSDGQGRCYIGGQMDVTFFLSLQVYTCFLMR